VFVPKVTAAAYAASTLPRFTEMILRLDVASAMLLPLMCREKVIGVASLYRSSASPSYSEADLRFACSLADHAALAIENARSYARERTARAAAVEARERLSESETAHRVLFDASPMPLFVFDVDTLEFLAVNGAATRLYGYEHAEFMAMQLKDLRPPEDRGTVRSEVSRLGDVERAGVVRHQRKDGSRFFAEYTSRALAFSGRRARITVITDVTARREAEEMRALLAAIVQTANDAIISKNLEGVITSWNSAAESLFGYTAEEAIGQPIRLIVPDDRVDEERALLAEIAAGHRVDHFETTRRRKDGSEVAVAISLAPIRDAQGRVVGASKTGRDLTAQRRAAEELRRSEEQLRQAQKMEAVGRLAGGVAHDFNNLLSVILSYSEITIAELPGGHPAGDDHEQIRRAAVRAADLTRQLLAFSRQQIVAPRVLDLNEILVGMHKMLLRILGEDVDLVSVPGAKIGRLFADPSSVEQVIMNLVVNARDAMPRGGQLTIETANVQLGAEYAREHLGVSEGPYVMLAVSDTGEGMDAATQARIFEPFFTTKPLGKGTGLGLSTVLGIVQQAHGTIWVYSEPGSGTTFKVYFPRVETTATAPVAPGEARPRHGSETILLVEDQEQVRTVAAGILRRNGYRVFCAGDAAEAVALAAHHPGIIHLLLTDVVMPRTSGAELAREIAKTRPETRVLFMSGYTDDSVVRHGVLDSGLAFLQKPFGADSLGKRVREVLDGEPSPPVGPADR
jgi:PAS domain S-box-containing protein